MAYKIAVASSDGNRVDVSFGAAKSFLIYEVDENNHFYLREIREYTISSGQEAGEAYETEGCSKSACGQDHNSGAGCTGTQGGCGGQDGTSLKIALVDDCRCVLCRKLGFPVRKQLEKKAITVFDIEYEIDAAIRKIIQYFDRLDHHQNLRGIAGQS